MKPKKLFFFLLPAVIVVALDQITKYWVRTTPAVQNWDIIPGWLSFHYTLNPGMALGMDWMPTHLISIVSICITIGFIGMVLYNIKESNLGFLLCWGLILGGALGNIIDRLILAKIQGYGGILDGHVVDFIHFTATVNGYPVFPYIFNVADIAISTALIALLLFHKKLWPHPTEDEEKIKEEIQPASLQNDRTRANESLLESDADHQPKREEQQGRQ